MRETEHLGGVVAWVAGLLTGATLVAMAIGYPAAALEGAETDDRDVAIATFEGQKVPADEVWEVATACVVSEDGAMECYRTAEERAFAEEESTGSLTADGEAGLSSSCPVRLYSSIFYGGTELTLNTRLLWHTLSYYGFNNTTSSYKISGCPATFRDQGYGGGSTYPGATNSWAWSSTMASGWNNRVSSVWIH